MIGIFVILLVSWLCLRYSSSENLKVLGPFPFFKRLLQFCAALLFAFLLNSLFLFAEASLRGVRWELSNPISASEILAAVYYHLRSSLTEDLIFRGALLYILLTKTKTWIGLLVSAIAFGVYHWFSYGVLNESLVVLLYVFVTTGLMGFVWAYGFHKTKSMALGWGLHMGWNMAFASVLVAQPYGELIFTASNGTTFSETIELCVALSKGLLPAVFMYLYIRLQ